MTQLIIPDFATLLAPYIVAIPQPWRPAFLARLERSAADRYRGWAEAMPEYREPLLACAAREDDIAARIEQVLPAANEQDIETINNTIEPARDCYYAAFATLPLADQLSIQANAERQGALAW